MGIWRTDLVKVLHMSLVMGQLLVVQSFELKNSPNSMKIYKKRDPRTSLKSMYILHTFREERGDAKIVFRNLRAEQHTYETNVQTKVVEH